MGFSLDTEKIQRLLAKRGWKAAHLAEISGLTQSTLTRVITQGKNADLDTMIAIANALDIKNHMSLEKGYVDPDAVPPRDPSLVYFIVGFRKEMDIGDATELNDAHPIVEWLRAQPNVEHVSFVRFTPISSILIEIELSVDATIDVVIPFFAKNYFAMFGITALYLPREFVNYVTAKPIDSPDYWDDTVPGMPFDVWLLAHLSWPVSPSIPIPATTLLDDGSVVLTPAASIDAPV